MSSNAQFHLRPLYEQVTDELVRRIVSREWKPGTVIPNEADLARELGISVGTVRKAFSGLCEMQMVTRVPGKGTTVIDQVDTRANHRFINTRDEAGNPVLGELQIPDAPREVEADERLARVFGLAVGAPLLRFERLRVHRGRIFTTEEVHIPAVPGDKLSLAERVRLLWFDHDITVEKSERIEASRADERDAADLSVALGSSLFRSTRLIYGYRGRVLEHRVGSIHLGEDLTFVIGPPERRLWN